MIAWSSVTKNSSHQYQRQTKSSSYGKNEKCVKIVVFYPFQENLGSVSVAMCYLPTSEKLYVTVESAKDLIAMDRQTGLTGKSKTRMAVLPAWWLILRARIH